MVEVVKIKGRLLFHTLNDFFEIGSPQVNIFPLDNIYNRYPYFRFYFKQQSLEFYDYLISLIDNYEDGSMWKMYKPSKGKSYMIIPKSIWLLKEQKSEIKNVDVKESVDMAISNIDDFCDYLKLNLIDNRM